MRRPAWKVVVILGAVAAAVWATLPSAQGAGTGPPPDVFVQVETAGAGSGQVFGPDGICVWNGTTQSGSCSGSHPQGSGESPLKYTAFPAGGSTFVKWEGCDTVQGQECYVDRDPPGPAEVVVTATFGLPNDTLTVLQPVGGKVSGQGINCGDGGTDCSESVAKGTKVNLTATPMQGYQFVRWEGACAQVTTNVCEVTVDGPTTVGAIFQSTTVSTVTVQPPMAGRIESTPSGINCGMGNTACSSSFPNGTKVTFRFIAMPGYVFASWQGACGEFDVTVCVLVIDNSVFIAVEVKKAPKCKCRDLTPTVVKKGFGSAEGTGQGRRLTRFFFPVKWTLRCTAGVGKRCKGKLFFEEGPGFDVVDMYRFVKNKKGKRVRKPVKSPFTCKGKCKRNQSTITRDTIRINMDSARSFAQLAGGSFTFDVKTRCSGETTEYRFRVNMGPNGRVRSVTRSVLV